MARISHSMDRYTRILKIAGIVSAVLILCLAFSTLSFSQDKRRKVLVLHSYHQGFEWTDNITRGIQSVFKDSQTETDLVFDYLDTKRHNEKDYSDKVADLLALKSRKDRYDAILVCDNNALLFLKEHASTLYPGTSVVFCGINNYSRDMIDGLQNVTGVEEFVDHSATLHLMMALHPDARKILVVVDSSLTGSEVKKTVEKAAETFKNKVQFDYYDQFLFNDIPGKMATLGPKDLIYLTVLNVDKTNRFISYKEGIDAITSTARVPVYGSWDMYLGKGIVGGMITSGFDQGKEGALMVLKILNGENAGNIPIKQKSRTGYMFDYSILKKFGIPESRLPRGSVLINSPHAFLENTHEFMIGLVIVSLFIAMGFYLKIRKEKKRTEGLQRLNEHLDSLVSEKTRKLNEINQQLSTMLNTMPSPVFFKDTKGVFKGCNKALADIVLGLSVSEIVGASPGDLEGRIPKDLAEFYAEKDRELIENPGVQSYEAQVRCADGIRRDFLINKATLHNETGRVVGLVGVMMDISKRRQAEQERETLIEELHVANEKLEKLSVTDSLTGLSNRGHITKRIKEEIRKADRYKSTFSIIIVDLDRFKSINDTYGHLVGDLALQTVARVLRENIRDIDAVGRYGGEEFLVLLPNTDIDSGYQIAERIRKNIESMTWVDEVTITISGGIAEYNGETDEELFRKADELLYRAKQGGRNRIEKMMAM